MAPTPSSSSKSNQILFKTPQSKHRLNFTSARNTTPNPNSTAKESAPQDHPIEVVGRIRNFPNPNPKEKPISVLQVNPDKQTLRVRADFGYRDFSLDGVSLSEEEDLDSFYKKFVESRISGVKLGEKCTIMMYGPTGSGKSHTMFGCAKQPGIVYKSLKDILGDESDNGEKIGFSTFVQVTVLEIYNEEIYDLLSSNNGGGFGIGWPKGSGSKVRLEVMGKKAKNATFISGIEAGKISKEIQKVEKRRIVKSTQCNERSSRSHCMIILDVPTVGGRLMLVDMAGSENIEQAGQTGFEAKMQTAKINQGNIALKRVVESIANGDSHVPFRDSKLTMLLQDSFEDDKSKILMVLCASPDPKEIHKTICTLEYGAKAKCIIRGPHTPDKIGAEDSSSAVILGSKISAMDQFIYKLQMENKLREKERNEAHDKLLKKEEEVSQLRAKLQLVEEKGSGASEQEINMKVTERTQILKHQLEKKLEECQRMAEEFVDIERRRMEERILQQQQEVEMLRRRLEEIEFELCHSRDRDFRSSKDLDGSSFARRLMGIYADEDPGMVKSMDLDMGDVEPFVRDLKHVDRPVHQQDNNEIQGWHQKTSNEIDEHEVFASKYGDKVCLSTVFEEEEIEDEEDDHKESAEDEVEKVIIEEKRVCSSGLADGNIPSLNLTTGLLASSPQKPEDTESSRRLRIQNIFTLCGNNRELSQHMRTPVPAKRNAENIDPLACQLKTVSSVPMVEPVMALASKENYNHSSKSTDVQVEVCAAFTWSQDGNSWDVQDGTSKILLYPILKLQFWFLIPAVVIPSLIFLLTPIRIPLSVSRPISVSCGELSVLLAVSVVATVILAPSLFLVAYLCLIILSLCYAALASLFKRCFNWLRNLTVITPITRTILIMIYRVNGDQEIPEQVDEENIIEVEGIHIQALQPSSSDDDDENIYMRV
ncbi:kinesin-like protein KIN-10A [Citrus sinensis]|uniref:Kinesin-like protein KIN-10A n=2 Tax=Citrus sinensis TaxID=2711 RepID=A0ACB8I4D6_CITSI|nr:kinesin-like protein KIN-10A [Citrus sinensis]